MRHRERIGTVTAGVLAGDPGSAESQTVTHRAVSVADEHDPTRYRAVCSCGWKAAKSDVNPNTAWPRARMHERRAGGCQCKPSDPATDAMRTEARRLVELYAERRDLTAAMARHDRPTGAMAQAVLDKGAELDAACEQFRQRFYPRSGRVFVGLYSVLVASPAGRRHRTVYDGFAEFTEAARAVSGR